VKIRGEHPPERLDLAGREVRDLAVASAGNRLAFSRDLWNNDIWRYQPGGAPEPLIVSTLGEAKSQFSPDGSRIVFASSRSGETFEIWVVNADGSHPVQLTNRLGRFQESPRWSPDGRWIAFDSQGQDGHWDIWVVEASGGRPRRITAEPSDEHAPSWSRDGRWIYFDSDRAGRRQIWRAAFAGGPERPVLDFVAYRAFAVVEDGIYYIGWLEDRLNPLQFYQFSTARAACSPGLKVRSERA
jgi:dipeptidyl aminopeptidase/acylaminoacyl peptidase